jgi:hypothetical protein
MKRKRRGVGNHLFSGWLGNVVKCTVEIYTVLNTTSEILNSSFEKTKSKMWRYSDCPGNEISGVEKAFSSSILAKYIGLKICRYVLGTKQALGKLIRRY